MYFWLLIIYWERIVQEFMVFFFNDVLLEDFSLFEGMQVMLNSGVLKEFYVNDEEILVWYLYKVVQDYVVVVEWEK